MTKIVLSFLISTTSFARIRPSSDSTVFAFVSTILYEKREQTQTGSAARIQFADQKGLELLTHEYDMPC